MINWLEDNFKSTKLDILEISWKWMVDVGYKTEKEKFDMERFEEK